jgi:PhzF family phenazine biosynthesis protein
VSSPLYQVDAFTAEPFAGNPAAVCLLEADADPAWMQAVAAEMNLPETAFLRPAGGPGRYGLRWFTSTVEVELCGHATATWSSWPRGGRARPGPRPPRPGRSDPGRRGG